MLGTNVDLSIMLVAPVANVLYEICIWKVNINVNLSSVRQFIADSYCAKCELLTSIRQRQF